MPLPVLAGRAGTDFKLWATNADLEADGADSGTCNYASASPFVSAFRDCTGGHGWHIGTYKEDCLGTGVCETATTHTGTGSVWVR